MNEDEKKKLLGETSEKDKEMEKRLDSRSEATFYNNDSLRGGMSPDK